MSIGCCPSQHNSSTSLWSKWKDSASVLLVDILHNRILLFHLIQFESNPLSSTLLIPVYSSPVSLLLLLHVASFTVCPAQLWFVSILLPSSADSVLSQLQHWYANFFCLSCLWLLARVMNNWKSASRTKCLCLSPSQASYRRAFPCRSRSPDLSSRAWVITWVSTGPDYSEQRTMEGIGDKGGWDKKKKKCEDDPQGLTGSTGPSSAGASESCAPLKCITCLQIQPRAALVALETTSGHTAICLVPLGCSPLLIMNGPFLFLQEGHDWHFTSRCEKWIELLFKKF